MLLRTIGLLLTLAFGLAPLAADAQPAKVPRVGALSPGNPPPRDQ